MSDRWLGIFGVPRITTGALAAFRAFLGSALFLILACYDPIRVIPAAQQQPYSPLADADWLQALAASENGMLLLAMLGFASAALFAVGVLARPAYAVLVAVLTLHVTMVLLRRGVHDWDLPLVTLIGLLAVPWGAAPPVWRMTSTHASRAYGFAVWLPGLTLGLAFAAAAFAKLQRSGLEWITTGAVKYHFVEDSVNAPSTLGLWIATQPDLAVAMSAAAVLIELSFILVVFVRGWRARAAFGLIAAGLMCGFYLFQGVRWWPWVILLAAFLPWNRSSRGQTGADRGLTWAQAGVVAALISAQVVASARGIEVEPLLSNYPMYSLTYESPEAFERNHERVRFEANGLDITGQVETAGGRAPLLAIAEHTGENDSALAGALIEFRARYERLHGPVPAGIDVVIVRTPFDWERGRYLPLTRTRLASIPLRP